MLTWIILETGSRSLVLKYKQHKNDYNTRKEWLAELEKKPWDIVFADFMEPLTTNGWELIAPVELAALTEAPILGYNIKRLWSENQPPEWENEIAGGDIFWFPNYMITDPLRELLTTGSVVFDRAYSEEDFIKDG